MTRCGGLRVCVCVCPVQLPDIHDDDDDKLDLAASLPNPITNAMEASMTHLKLDNKDWGDDGTGVGLANLLSDATAAEDTRTPVSTRTRCVQRAVGSSFLRLVSPPLTPPCRVPQPPQAPSTPLEQQRDAGTSGGARQGDRGAVSRA